jgi:hypothetical protein
VKTDLFTGNYPLSASQSPDYILHASLYRANYVLLKFFSPAIPISIVFLMNILQLVMSMFVCVLFVENVTFEAVPDYWPGLSVGFSVFFLLDYIRRGVAFQEGPSWVYFVQFNSIMDLLSLISLLYNTESWLSFAFLRVFIVGRSLVEMKELISDYVYEMSSVFSQILVLIIESISLIFAFASLIYILETLGPSPWESDYDPSAWTMFTSVYFMMITMATVGYGDFTATTVLGRIFVLVFVVSGVALFAHNTNKIIGLMEERRRGFGKYIQHYGDAFIIVCGHPQIEIVKHFVDDVFSREFSSVGSRAAHKFHIVVLMRADSDFRDDFARIFENNPMYKKRVTFVNGSPMDSQDLLKRVKGENADGIFLLSNPYSSKSGDDAANVLRAMAIQRICPDLPVYMNIGHPYFRGLFAASSLKTHACVFSNRLMSDVLAISCTAPVFSTFFYSLLKHFGSTLESDDDCSHSKEYSKGLAYEFFTVFADSRFFGVTLGDVCLKTYRKHHGEIVVVGVGNPVRNASNSVKNYEYRFDPEVFVSEGALLLIIANDVAKAEEMGVSLSPDMAPSVAENYLTVNSFYGAISQIHPLERVSTLKKGFIQRQERSKSPAASMKDMKGSSKSIGLSRVGSLSRKVLAPKYSPSQSEADLIEQVSDDEKGDMNVQQENPHDLHAHVFLGPPTRDMHDHIVVVSSTTKDLGFFVRRTRVMERASGSERRPILIVSEENYKSQHFSFVKRDYLLDVHFFKGKLKQNSGFQRCRLHKAKCIVIVGLDSSKLESQIASEEELVDSYTAFMWYRIKNYLHSRNASERPTLVAELKSESSLKYVQPINSVSDT